MNYIYHMIRIISYTLIAYPITVFLYSLFNTWLKLNWMLPCGYNNISFPIFMTCLFCFVLFMTLRERNDYVSGAVFGSILLFALFHSTVYNVISWVVTIVFSMVLIKLVFSIWRPKEDI